MVLIVYLIAGVSMRVSNFLLSSTKHLLTLRGYPENGEDSDIPSDVRTVLDTIHLHQPTHAYVCCLKCFCTYAFDPKQPSYPERCTFQQTPGSPVCDAPLRKGVSPTREFIYNDLRHWIGWMISRPDIAQYLARDPLDAAQAKDPTKLQDIWDGEILRTFYYDDHKPFARYIEGELRLIFSFNQDAFNPYGNRVAKKVVQIGGMYMALLNLPPAIRHDMENIFLAGIVPGPSEPSMSQINHVLRPLVDDLLEFWRNGVFYTRACNYPSGVLVRVALVPVVCDLPAACQIAGFGAYNSGHDCLDCYHIRDNMDDVDVQSFVYRDEHAHRELARAWRDAMDDNMQDLLYSQSHIRWSELLRLPYWDPTKFVVIDSMHCFYLGLLHRHCRDIWGMDTQYLDGDGITFDQHKKAPTEDEMVAARIVLATGTKTAVGKLRVNVLSELCKELGLRFGLRRTSKHLLQSLMDWVCFIPASASGLLMVAVARQQSSQRTKRTTFRRSYHVLSRLVRWNRATGSDR